MSDQNLTDAANTDAAPRELTLPDLYPYEDEPWLDPEEAFERFLEWAEARGINLWPHQEEALLSIAAGDHVILGTPTGSGKSMVALGMLFMALTAGKRA